MLTFAGGMKKTMLKMASRKLSNRELKVKQREQHTFMYELGKFMVDIAKLVFGGIILAGIMSEDINRQLLFSCGSLVVLAFALLGLYIISKNKEVK